MTVADLSERLTLDEEAGWSEYYQLKAEDEKAAMDAAKSGMRR